jgi:superfamily II helicase
MKCEVCGTNDCVRVRRETTNHIIPACRSHYSLVHQCRYMKKRYRLQAYQEGAYIHVR